MFVTDCLLLTKIQLLCFLPSTQPMLVSLAVKYVHITQF